MKVEHIEPFAAAARTVLAQLSNGMATQGTLGLAGTTFRTASINIMTRVTGSLRGDVIYSMSSLTAEKLVAMVSGDETHVFGRRMGSGLVKLGEMLSAQSIKWLSDLNMNCMISSPTVFQGLNVEFSSSSPALTVPIETSAGRVEVSVAVDDDTTI